MADAVETKKIKKDDLKKLVDDTAAKMAGQPDFNERAVKTAVTLDLHQRNLRAKNSDVRRFVNEAVHDSLLLKRYTARLRYARISERKLRLVMDQIRGKDVNLADNILKVSNKRGGYYLRKLLQSAIANATFLSGEKRTDLDVNKLTITRAEVTPGVIMKRTRPSSERRPYLIRKRLSHAIIQLEEREPKLPKSERGKKKAEPKPKPKIEPAAPAAEAPKEPPKQKKATKRTKREEKK
jgi:large subunit ribosomal protein L22